MGRSIARKKSTLSKHSPCLRVNTHPPSTHLPSCPSSNLNRWVGPSVNNFQLASHALLFGGYCCILSLALSISNLLMKMHMRQSFPSQPVHTNTRSKEKRPSKEFWSGDDVIALRVSRYVSQCPECPPAANDANQRRSKETRRRKPNAVVP